MAGSNNNSPTTKMVLAARAYELKLAGKTVTETAKEMEVAESTVHRYLQYYLEKRVAPTAEDYRKIIIDRLERMLSKCETGIQAGDTQAINTARALLGDLYKYNGLEVVKMEHTVTEVTQQDLEIMELIRLEKLKSIRTTRALNGSSEEAE